MATELVKPTNTATNPATKAETLIPRNCIRPDPACAALSEQARPQRFPATAPNPLDLRTPLGRQRCGAYFSDGDSLPLPLPLPLRYSRWKPQTTFGAEAGEGGAFATQSVSQISIFDPSSTTALLGRFRKSAAALALRCICANSFSLQGAMPLPIVGITVSRERK